MRRMISDKQLNELKSKNLKIIELDTPIKQATITQEQMDIFFPKDAQGNIHKPDYYIVITDNLGTSGSGGFNYLGFWSPTSIRFNRLGTNSYYTWTIGPNDTKFTQTRTNIGGGGATGVIPTVETLANPTAESSTFVMYKGQLYGLVTE